MHCHSCRSRSFNAVVLRTRAGLVLMVALVACSRSRSHEPSGKRAPECSPGTVLVLGACVTPAIARDVCGPSLLPLAGGCAPRPPCKRGEARDADADGKGDAKGEGTGACIVASRVRALTEGTSLTLGDDDDVGCDGEGADAGAAEQEEELVERGGELACVARAAPIRPGPIGMVMLDLGRTPPGTCVRVKHGELVDAALWLRAVVGPSGGLGTPTFCRALERASVREGYGQDIEVVLRFVDNDVSQLELRARTGGRPADPALERVLLPFANAARALGGASQTSEAATRVRCGGDNEKKRARSSGPRAIPRRSSD
jgi:hypothetical protein